MKSILFAIGSLNIGGAEKILLNYVNHIAANMSTLYKVEILLLAKEGKLLEYIHPGVKINFLYQGNDYIASKNFALKYSYKFYRKILMIFLKLFPSFIRVLNKNIGNKDFLFVLVQDLWWISKFQLAKTNVLWIQNNLKKIDDSSKYMDQKIYDDYFRVIAISDGIKSDLIDRLRINENKILKCNNPIIISDVINKSKDRAVFNQHSFDFNSDYIVSMGRLVDQKGFDLLLEAFSKVLYKYPNLKLVIIGGGSGFNDLLKIGENLGLAHGVHYYITGNIENPYPIISRSNLFVCSSKFDGLSTSILESMSLGIPVLSTPCEFGPKEILGINEFGVLSSEISANSLSTEILKFLANNEAYIKYREKSIQRSLDFDISHTIKIIESNILNIDNT
jgi:glycosyltransferase involved in cell wall biosynthesis